MKVLFTVLPLVLCSAASAQLLPGVTAQTNMGTFRTYSIANLTNGAGLSTLDLTATHSNMWQDCWLSNAILTGWIEFDLGSIVSVNTIGVWNYNATFAQTRGIQTTDVYTSVDGQNYTMLSTENFPIGTGQPLPAHLINAGGVQAQFVKFDNIVNHGNTGYTGLGEVQFDVSLCNGRIAISGTGCADSGGVVNHMTYTGCPDQGTQLILELNTSPGATGPLFLIFGLTDQNWGGIVLPLDLTGFGAPGCTNYISQDFMLGGLAPSGGQATVGLSIPVGGYLVGATSYVQFYHLDPGLNALNLAASDYITITIG